MSDDGSTDGTIEVASRYQQTVRVVRGAWCGPSGARNRGAATATGDVLAFVDSGDVPCDAVAPPDRGDVPGPERRVGELAGLARR